MVLGDPSDDEGEEEEESKVMEQPKEEPKPASVKSAKKEEKSDAEEKEKEKNPEAVEEKGKEEKKISPPSEEAIKDSKEADGDRKKSDLSDDKKSIFTEVSIPEGVKKITPPNKRREERKLKKKIKEEQNKKKKEEEARLEDKIEESKFHQNPDEHSETQLQNKTILDQKIKNNPQIITYNYLFSLIRLIFISFLDKLLSHLVRLLIQMSILM